MRKLSFVCSLYLLITNICYADVNTKPTASMSNALKTERQKMIEQGKLSCGDEYAKLIAFEMKLQKLVKQGEGAKTEILNNMIKYPLQINVEGKQIWLDKAEVLTNYTLIFTDELLRSIIKIEDFAVQFCRNGFAYMDDFFIGLSPIMKIQIINYAGKKAALKLKHESLGTPVMPLVKREQLQAFINLVQRSKFSKLPLESDYTKLQIVKNNDGKTYRLCFSNDCLGSEEYQLYYVDLSNEHEAKYIMTYTGGGTMHTSGIVDIFAVTQENKLNVIDFNTLLHKNTPLEESGYLFINDPFITYKNGKYYMHYVGNGVCSYIWQGGKITFKWGDKSCAH